MSDINYFPCKGCGQEFHIDELEDVDGDPYCQFCYEELLDKVNTDAEEER